MGMAGMQDVLGGEQIAAFVAGGELQARHHRGRQAYVVEIHLACGDRVQQADDLRGAAWRHQRRMRGGQPEDFVMRTPFNFHVLGILYATLVNHASEHGRSDRTTAEACRHNPDFGLWILFLPLFCLVDELQVHLFHPWTVAIAQRTVEFMRPGIVLSAYAGDVVASDVFNTVNYCGLHLIVQYSDIGDVFWILVLVVAGAIEASHEQTSVWVLLTDQQRRLELRQLMAAVCIYGQVLRRRRIDFHGIRPFLWIGLFVAHCMLPGDDAISRFWCRRGSGRCGSHYIYYLAPVAPLSAPSPSYTH